MSSFFLLRSSFFRTTRPLASSEAMAYYRPAPGETSKTMNINPSLQILGCTQRNESWIKGLGKNPQKSELIHWRQCLLSGATEPCPLRLRETLACVYVIPQNVTPHVACWHGSRPNSQQSRPNKDLRVYTASVANWLRYPTQNVNFLTTHGFRRN